MNLNVTLLRENYQVEFTLPSGEEIIAYRAMLYLYKGDPFALLRFYLERDRFEFNLGFALLDIRIQNRKLRPYPGYKLSQVRDVIRKLRGLL